MVDTSRSTLEQGGAALILIDIDALMADPGDRAMVEALSEGLATAGTFEQGVILIAGDLP